MVGILSPFKDIQLVVIYQVMSRSIFIFVMYTQNVLRKKLPQFYLKET